MTTDDQLRHALTTRADQIEFAPDALGSIRRRIQSGQRRRRTWSVGLASLAVGGVAVLTTVLIGLVGCLPTRPPSVSPPPGAASTSPGLGTAAPTGPASVSPSPSGPTPAGVRVSLPVYYLGGPRTRPVLYREFRDATVPTDTVTERMAAAVAMVLAGAPLDPDYTSGWPSRAQPRSVTIAEVTADGGVAVVDLAGAQTNSADPAIQRAAVQQLVWTVTAVAADQGAKVRGVRLLFDGVALSTVWSAIPTADVLIRASAPDTLAAIWLISPQQGDTVGRSVDVHVAGAVFEAAARVRVRDSAGAVVLDRPVALSIGAPQRGEAHLSLTLQPGRYTIEAYYLSAVDGSVQSLDDKTITVA